MNEEIIGKLFDRFKEQYGSTVANPVSLFDGQRDLLTFMMGGELEGVTYRFKGHRRCEVQGLFGKIGLRRAYYVAGEGRTYFPLDCQLSVEGHTPGLQYFLAQFTGQNVYQEALDHFHRIFRPDGRDLISMRKALDMDYELGEGLEGLRQEEIRQVLP